VPGPLARLIPLGVILGVLLLALAPTVPPPASAVRDPETPAPLVWELYLADPTVVEHHSGYLALGTGPLLARARSHGARGRWHGLPPPLTVLPSWVLPGELWAPHLEQVQDGSWVLYYAAPAAGLPPGGRCIGTATAPTASGPFAPYGDVPLVCPPRLGAVPAEDQLLDRPADLPASGVIDPSVFVERDGRVYLLYKTQGRPSSIRMVLLTPDGLHVAPGMRSKMLFRSNGMVENPTLLHQGSHYVLFTSEGWYGDCDYRTTWRKSKKKWRWRERSTNFLGPEITGLCGPGGADVVVPRKPGRMRMFFHGWVCYATSQPCPRPFRVDRDDELLPVRGMYGALLDWGPSDAPRIADYLVPRGRTGILG
jgi:arabinan endo-1,5-alpha-L-arabinosidase